MFSVKEEYKPAEHIDVTHTERTQPPNNETLVTATFCRNTNTIKIKEMAGTRPRN